MNEGSTTTKVHRSAQGCAVGVQLHDKLHAAERVDLIETHIVIGASVDPVVGGLDDSLADKIDGIRRIALMNENHAALQLFHLERVHQPERRTPEILLELLLPVPAGILQKGQGVI